MDHKKIKKLKIKEINLGGIFPPVFAATSVPLGEIGGKDGFGPWGELGSKTDINSSAGIFANVISRIIGVMTIIAGIWFLFQFLIGGLSFMTAGGDQQKISNATKKITSAFIGLVIVVVAYAVMSLLGEILGFKFLEIVPLIEKLKPGGP